LGLPDLRVGGHTAGDPRRVGHQPPASVDTATVADHAGGALCLCFGARPWGVCRNNALQR
jgi:hypothetical protein